MYSYAPLDKKYILERISEEDIFHKYLGIYPNTEDYFTNPTRADTHADCKFYRSPTTNALKFKDFAGGKNWDCFDVVQVIESDVNNFYDALRRIAKDFNLYGSEINYDVVADFEKKVLSKRKKAIIQVKRRPWEKQDLLYWAEQQIKSEQQLEKFNVAPIEVAWLGENIIYNYSKNDPCYVYYFGGRDYKLYFPKRKNGRFLQTRGDILQGALQLPEEGRDLIVTKSYKDVIVMDTFDIVSIAPMSESILITEEQFENLSNRFFNIYSLMDRDRSGMRMAQILRNKYNIEPLLFESKNRLFRSKDEPKDFTEQTIGYGTNYMLELIAETKERLS